MPNIRQRGVLTPFLLFREKSLKPFLSLRGKFLFIFLVTLVYILEKVWTKNSNFFKNLIDNRKNVCYNALTVEEEWVRFRQLFSQRVVDGGITAER